MTFTQIIDALSGWVWGWPMIVLLVGTHVFLTVRLRVPQRRLLTGIRLSVQRDKGATGDVSQFGALATSLAATIGTGNIIGVATAVALGGPGAVLWCWITGVFGIATKYGEGLLAVKYRRRTSDGRMLGGPMYALETGLGQKWLAVLFALFTAVAAFGIGNTVQANAISANVTQLLDGWVDGRYTQVGTGLFVAVFIGLVVIGGVRSIARICTALVPLMAVFYVLGCLYILCMNWAYIGEAVRLICGEAFSLRATLGGTAGTALMMGARYGIARGLFSNESGMGSAPIVAAAARTRNPVRQALVSSTGTFWDTVVICAITGLVVVSSMVANPDVGMSDGAMLTRKAFGMIPVVGTPILTFGILTFALSTILGWSYYGERAVEYLAGRRFIKWYRIVWVVLCFAGSVMSLDVVWNIADIMNALMAVPNLISLLLLSGVLARETDYYLWGNRLDEEAD